MQYHSFNFSVKQNKIRRLDYPKIILTFDTSSVSSWNQGEDMLRRTNYKQFPGFLLLSWLNLKIFILAVFKTGGFLDKT